MSPEHPQEPPLGGTALPQIDSRAGFAAAVHWGVTRAVDAGARRIVCVDRDFSD
jgi:hypothetical protein